ncbi:hypothetical protein GQF03_02715 [Sneathiella chungangensis]|uniref:Tetratricopeptide repeat protein n=1 Tax=Sneathiella chungangensis TaxID=1418234 RepID=A0A845MBL6_9PROT|nr:hypothetical protein [Sneathiella chungangensis]MZR21235.1 hypothetical protein [Sneathiella chungangensis]
MNRVSSMSIKHRIGQFLLAGILVIACLWAEAMAAVPVKVTAADTGNVGRLTFGWDKAPEFSTELEDGYLYIRFTTPFDADLAVASAELRNYVGPGEFLEGRQSVRFPLKGEVRLASKNDGNLVIVELEKPAAGQTGTASDASVRVRLRAGDHKDFSRLVFDWPTANTGYSSRVVEDRLEITFDGRAEINVKAINNDPLNFAKSVSLSASGDKTQVTVRLAPGSAATSFRNEKSIVFDIRKGPEKVTIAEAQPDPEPETKPVKTPAVKTVPEAVARAPEPVAPVVTAKAEPVATKASPDEPVATSKGPVIELPVVNLNDKKATVAPAKKPTEKTEEKIEIAREKASPQPIASSGVVEMATPQEDDRLGYISPASGSAIAPIGPTIVLDPPAEKEEIAAVEPEKPEPIVIKDAGEEPVAKVEQPKVVAKQMEAPQIAQLKVKIANLKDGFRLIFPWDEPAAMAMFESGGAHWVIFDRPAEADFSNLSGPYKFLVSSARQLADQKATLLRFNFREGYAPKVDKVNEEWFIDFTLDARPVVTHPLGVQTQGISASEFRAFIPAVHNGREVRFLDPESQEELVAMPLTAAGYGIPEVRVFNGITILPTVQGVALRSSAGEIRIGREQNGFAVTAISNEYAAPQEPKEVPKKPGEEIYPTPSIEKAQLVRLAEWRQVNPVLFTIRKQELQNAIATAEKKDQRKAKMTLAKFFVGQKYYAEALGVLAELIRRYPKIEKDKEYRLLMGLAELGQHHYDAAALHLYDEGFEGDVEVAPWRGMISAGLGDWERAAQELNYSAPAFTVFEKEWADHFRLLRARAALENVDVNLAKQVLDEVKTPDLPSQKAEKSYLEGVLALQLSDFPTAAAKFTDAIKVGYRPITEKARFDKINVDLVAKLITPEQAIAEIEKLDFAWRGDELEVEVQKRLGDLYVATGQIGNGLETYKRIVRHFPESPYSRILGRKMNDLFAELFLEGGADNLPPVKALAIYYQYRELTPVGDRGDKMIQILADRLTRVDLLEQAAQLLEHQVSFRLKGAEKAAAGTKLAIVHLWNDKPEEALRALYDTRWRQLSPEAKKERLHIEARAQAGLQHYKEALALIESDRSLEADELRAEIHWKSRNWAQAIPAIEKLIGNGGNSNGADFERLDRQRIMQLAVALNLSDDKRGIRQLRDKYREKMEGTVDQAAFDLITEQNDPSETEFRERATVIAKVGQLESFMAGYREKLENGQFWATY